MYANFSGSDMYLYYDSQLGTLLVYIDHTELFHNG